MFKIGFLVFFAVGIALMQIPSSCSAKQRDLIIVPDGKPVALSHVYAHSYALLIGINRYKNLSEHNLHYAVADVKELQDLLVRYYGFPPDNVVTLLDEQATHAAIEAELIRLTDRKRIHPQDRILIYFSGHGQTVPLPDSGEMGFLIPSDAQVDLDDPANASPYLATCLKMTTLWDYLDASPAKHVLLIADACYSGLLEEDKAPTVSPETLAEWSGRRAREVMTAGEKQEKSRENSSWGHGAFTFKLLEELRVRSSEVGSVFTASGLYGSLQTPVSNLTGGKQTPQMRKHKYEGEFLFIPCAPTHASGDSGGGSAAPEPLHGSGGLHTIGRARPANPQQGDLWINPKDGAELVFIPAGPFPMGDNDVSYIKSDNPRHTVTLSGYWIYKNVVTVGQYKGYVAAMKAEGKQIEMPPAPSFDPRWNQEDHPMVNVSWEDAKSYCEWAGVRLPTEAEWEKAARGTDGRKYAFGNTFDDSKLWGSVKTPRKGTASVNRRENVSASPYGVLDMGGNVWQWCSDYYDENYWKSDHGADPQGPASGDLRVLRGGSWLNFYPDDFRSAVRIRNIPAIWNNVIGFRGASGL